MEDITVSEAIRRGVEKAPTKATGKFIQGTYKESGKLFKTFTPALVDGKPCACVLGCMVLGFGFTLEEAQEGFASKAYLEIVNTHPILLKRVSCGLYQNYNTEQCLYTKNDEDKITDNRLALADWVETLEKKEKES